MIFLARKELGLLSGLRNFIVVFLLALLGFGILGHFVATSIVPSMMEGDDGSESETSEVVSNDAGSEDSSDDISVDDSAVIEGNTFNFAFFCTDINDKLAGIYIIHTHDGYETCVTVPIPATAFVENNGAYTTLDKLFADYGKDFMITKLYYLTGCKIDEHATLSAVDVDGKGRNVTELSTYLKYTYKITEEFEYPNPDFVDGDNGNESEDVSEEIAGEFIKIETGSYALNGKTDGILNEQMLLDTEYNPNAFDIFSELITKMLNDSALAGNKTKQATVFNFIADKSFRNYDGSGASAYMFNDFRKASFAYSGTGGAWDEIREAVKTLERKVQ